MSILGWVLMIVLVGFGIVFDKDAGLVFDNLGNFWDASSFAVVMGGVITALMVSFPMSIFAKIPRHLKIIFMPKKYNPRDYIDQVVELAEEARTSGLLSLEAKLEECKDDFLKNGMMLVVDAVDAERSRASWSPSSITLTSATRRTALFTTGPPATARPSAWSAP